MSGKRKKAIRRENASVAEDLVEVAELIRLADYKPDDLDQAMTVLRSVGPMIVHFGTKNVLLGISMALVAMAPGKGLIDWITTIRDGLDVVELRNLIGHVAEEWKEKDRPAGMTV